MKYSTYHHGLAPHKAVNPNAGLTFTHGAIAILHCEDAVMTREQSVLYMRSRPSDAQTRVSCSVLKTVWPADETHHPGASHRPPSVPKAHTFARLLCRKTSPLSETYDPTHCCFGKRQGGLAAPVEAETRARGRSTEPVLYCAM